MQEDQVRDVLDHRRGEAELLEPPARHARADHLVMMEGHPPVGQPGPGVGLADVVQQRREPQHEVVLQLVAVLERDRLLQHGERVLVHVLVPEVLVGREPEPRHLGQHLLRHPRVDQEPDPADRVRREHDLAQLVPDPLGGHDLQPAGQPGHRVPDVAGRLEAELRGEPRRAHDAKRVVGEGVHGRARGAQDLVPQVAQPAVRIHQLARRQPGRHRVDGEVPAGEIPLQRRPVRHLRLVGAILVPLAPVRGDLEHAVTLAQAHGAELDPHRPGGVRPAGGDLQDLLRQRVGGQVEIVRIPAQEHVAHRAADQRELVAGPGEQEGEVIQRAGDGGQELGGGLALRRGQLGRVGHGHRG